MTFTVLSSVSILICVVFWGALFWIMRNSHVIAKRCEYACRQWDLWVHRHAHAVIQMHQTSRENRLLRERLDAALFMANNARRDADEAKARSLSEFRDRLHLLHQLSDCQCSLEIANRHLSGKHEATTN